MRQGTFIANDSSVTAGRLLMEGRGNRRILAGSSLFRLGAMPDVTSLRGVLEPANSILAVDDEVRPWGIVGRPGEAAPRDIAICGTGAGQTPFTVEAELTSDYNGFGVQCRGLCNATVTATVSGGSGNFTFAWLNGGPNSPTWTTACGGPQIVIVTDVVQNISCFAPVTVTEPVPLGVIFLGAGTSPSCIDACDGSRTALAVGGTGLITYNWNNGAGTGSSFSQLCAGDNTLLITDANGCTFDTTFSFIVEPILPNLVVTNASCNGVCDGAAEVNPTGGAPGITATWSPIGITGNSVSGLCAGDYSVFLIDPAGCDTTVFFTITEPPQLSLSISSTDAVCFGICDGTAAVTVSGSPGPFEYDWQPTPGIGQGDATVEALCEGTYTVTILDASTGCDTTLSVVIDAPPQVLFQETIVDATCTAACDGSISLVVSGGTPGYTYAWSPAGVTGQGTPNVSGLCAGSYTVTITDAAGCDTTANYTVGEPSPLSATLEITDVSCNGLCDGSVNAVVGGGTPGYTYLWTPAPGGGQGTPAATGLCAGAYTLLVADSNGCDTLLEVTISEPPPLANAPSSTDVTCGGLCDGTATADVSGGVAPYTYAWSPSPGSGQGTAQAGGLCPGTYTLTVTDSNGCIYTEDYLISDPVPITVVLDVVPATCPATCNGSADAVVSGGTGPYTYVWASGTITGQGTPGVSELCAGTYTLTVTDALGCDTTVAFTVTDPAPIEAQEVVVDATCADGCDGSISLVVIGGTPGYTYAWSPAGVTGQGTPNVSGLCAGSYTVTITDAAGCDTTANYTVGEPSPLQFNLETTLPTCSGTCDAVATASAVTGGTAPYTYSWSPAPPAGQGTGSASQLCPGAYSLTIADANGCDTTVAFIIDPAPLIVLDLALTPTGCGGVCTGTATVVASGGNGGFTYDWSPDPITGDGTPSIASLCSGAYALTVTDALGCDTTLQFVISTPSGIDAQPEVEDARCSDSCDGAINLLVSGGLPPYGFQWSPEPATGQGTPSVSGLCQGVWTVQVVDAAGCDTTLLVQVDAPSAIVPNLSFTNETCNGPCDGAAALSPTGGVGPYQFNWTPAPLAGQGTSVASGLCAGDVSVVITDAAGCDTTVTFTVLPFLGIDAGLVTVDGLCPNSCSGEASVLPVGGVAPYSFVWEPDPLAGQGTGTVSGLCVGTYLVTVADAVGCDTSLFFNIEKPAPFEHDLVVQPEDCSGACSGSAVVQPVGGTPGYTYVWSPEPGAGQGTNAVTGLCSGTTYEVTIGDANLCDTTISFLVPPYLPIDPLFTSTAVTCSGSCDGTATLAPTGGQGPFSFLWVPEPGNGQGSAQGTGLCEGVYEVTVTDATGCSSSVEILITSPALLAVDATLQDLECNASCNGSVELVVSGGTGPYAYQWTPAPPAGQGTSLASALCAGVISVVVTDDAGCQVQRTFVLQEPPQLTAEGSGTTSQCQVCNGSVSVVVAGGSPPYDIGWTDASGAVVGVAPTVTGLCAGTYSGVITDANGCQLVVPVGVSDIEGEDLSVQDASVTCPGDCTGTLEAVFTCDDPPCALAWTDDAGQAIGADPVLAGLCPGSYTAVLTNASGCITAVTAVVAGPSFPQYSITSSPPDCNGLCNATAGVNLNGGVPPYTFIWTPEPAAGQGTAFASGLCAGSYEVQVTDGTGCDTTLSVVIVEPPLLELAAAVQDVACGGACDGRIDLLLAGGTAPFTIVWNPVPPNGQGVQVAQQLCAGTWSVVIADAGGCAVQAVYTVSAPDPLAVQVQVSPSSCGACDGGATPTISGGTAPFSYAWSLIGVQVSTDPLLAGVCPGVYDLVVTDANGCTAETSVPISDADGPELTAIDGRVTCFSDCNGVAGVTFTCNIGPCSTIWTDAAGTVIAQNLLTVPDLCTGIYTVRVINGVGCESVIDVEVVPAQVIVPDATATPASCAGVCDGAASVSPTGGAGGFTYSWSPEPGGGQNTPQATGLCAGIYSVNIVDAVGCDTLVQVLITAPPAITMSALVQDALCAGACDGVIEALVQGGVAPYALDWSPSPAVGQGTTSVDSLCVGPYTLSVTDQNGCTLDSTWTVNAPPPLVVQGSSTFSTCGVCDGSAGVTVSGGTEPYFVQWTLQGAIVGTGPSLTARCAGIYLAEVTDANGCTASLVVPISDVDGEDLTTVDGITTCPNTCDGSVQVSYTCGDPPCTVTWYDGGGSEIAQAVDQVDGLCPGDYFVQVVNNSGCLTVDTASVLVPDPIIANLGTTPVSCFGSCDGTATVAPTGGLAPYGYAWSPEPGGGQGTAAATGLCAGTYSVLITDANGCAIEQDVLITGPSLLTVDAGVTNASCSGVCDGFIELSPQGGTAPYTFLWTPPPPNGATGAIAEQLCPGPWQVLVSDANGCDTLLTFVVTEPAPLEAVLATVDNVCNGDCLGTAEVFVQGGTAPFVVTWRDAGGTVIAPDQTAIDLLCAGAYAVTVTDGNGCTRDVTFNIGQGQPIVPGLFVTGETCAGPCNGTAISTPDGGQGPYQFLWQPEPGAGQGTAIASGLCEGDYTVTITDQSGCDTTEVVTIAPYVPVDPGAVIGDAGCPGSCDGSVLLDPTGGIGSLSFIWSPVPANGQGASSATGLCAGDITVTVTDAALCATTYTYTIGSPAPWLVIVDEVVPATCTNSADGSIAVTTGGATPPLTFQWSGPGGYQSISEDISGLAPGDHALVVTDANGCDTTVVVNVPVINPLLADAGPDRRVCAGVEVLLEGVSNVPGVSFQWTDDQGRVLGDQPTIALGDLPIGPNTITLTVTDGACTVTDQVIIDVLELPFAQAGDDRSIFLGATTTLGGAPSGPPGSVFSWSVDTTLSAIDVPNPAASPTLTTWYTLTVVAPNGCQDTDSVLVRVLPELVIPSGFSPNGDGWNDAWIIDLIDLFPECEVEIYNRWGEMLFRSVGYKTPWDGRYNGGPVPVGTYYYIVKLNDPEYPDAYTGPLTVIR